MFGYMENKGYLCTSKQILYMQETVTLDGKHYDPVVAIADIEVMLNVSYGTARRRLKEMRTALGLSSRGRITVSQARQFFL